MNNEEFKRTIELFAKEKDIDIDYLFDSIELALNSAYKKQYRLPNSRVDLNRETGEIKIFSFKTVVLDKEHKESLDEGYKEEELTEEDFVTFGENLSKNEAFINIIEKYVGPIENIQL